MIRIKAHEEEIKLLKEDKESVSKFAMEIKAKLYETYDKAAKDKKMLQEGLLELRSQREKINELSHKKSL